jgi:hypothetical protein
MATRAAAHPFPASAPALKGAHTVAAVSRYCCLNCCCSCCLHPSPLQCNGRTGCCPPFSRLLPLLKKVRLLMLHRVAVCAVAAYTPRPCSAMATLADARPSPESAPAFKGAHTVAAVLRCCCLHCCNCCLHPSPLQCNGRTGFCPPFSRLCPCSKRCDC